MWNATLARIVGCESGWYDFFLWHVDQPNASELQSLTGYDTLIMAWITCGSIIADMSTHAPNALSGEVHPSPSTVSDLRTMEF